MGLCLLHALRIQPRCVRLLQRAAEVDQEPGRERGDAGEVSARLGPRVLAQQDAVRSARKGCAGDTARSRASTTTSDHDPARALASRRFDPNRQDKPILNTIALLDALDKNINTFAMRVREWFPCPHPPRAASDGNLRPS